MWKTFKYSLLVLMIILFQVSVLPLMGDWIQSVNIVLLVLILVYLTKGLPLTLMLALILGPILDLYHMIFFPGVTICLILALLIVDAFFSKFFTNKSFYSFLSMILLAVFCYGTLLRLLFGLQTIITAGQNYPINQYFTAFGQFAVEVLAVNFICGTILFMLFYFFSDNFKSVILRD
ncbi:TPA: hypothetical protein DF272_03430 [Candidatus Falkowbacteria bacterium]|nr:hypothetical protein [Candidatus Falkowbacteria bacterium]